ncbi:MAG: response regulator [Spirochaetaceae bacterium]|nr:response regulator [Spirochaetaceae bacterium]MCF7947363.1 response regulator [Spirochaetia bacterium]MCF7950299.1 response regulator [Spirochaetaceae bacterium]
MSIAIFIVDDEMILNMYLHQLLEEKGYLPTMVPSGEECLRRLAEGARPGLILMDINLGADRIDGPEATRRIYQHYEIPVVLHSAYTDKDTLEKARSMTKYGYVQKVPGNEQILLLNIEMALRLFQSEKRLKEREHFLENVFDSIRDGLCVINRDFEIVRMNEVLHSWSTQQEPKIGKKCYDFFNKRDRVCESCPFISTLNTGQMQTALFSQMKGVLPEWIEVSCYPLSEESTGEITGVVEHIRDVTKQHYDQQKINESHARAEWLNAIGKTGLESFDIREIAEYTVNLLSSHFTGYRVSCLKLSSSRVLYPIYSKSPPGMPPLQGFELDLSLIPQVESELRANCAVAVQSVRDDPRFRAIQHTCSAFSTESLLLEPIESIAEEEKLLLCFSADQAHAWSEHEQLSLQEVSDYLSLLLYNAYYRQELRSGEQRYRQLSAHLQEIREEQNEYISREIHDDLGQAMTALKMNLSIIQRALSPKKSSPDILRTRDTVVYMQGILDETVDKVREISRRLHPPVLDTAGIIEALEWQVMELRKYSEVTVNFQCNCEDFTMERSRGLAVFRIVQEALNNSIRHGAADSISVNVFRKPYSLHIELLDDGLGFDVADAMTNGSFGLMSMKERAAQLDGSLKIESAIGEGTRVCLTVPLKEDA